MSNTEVHPTHGRLIKKDPMFEEGSLYEDGTYVIKKIGDRRLNISNSNQGAGSMFYYDMSELSKIKKIEIEGDIIADRFEITASDDTLAPTSIDMTGLTLSDRAEIPFLAYLNNSLERVTFDPRFTLSKVIPMTRMFDGATKLKLTNEQVSQLLRNTAFDTRVFYNGPIFRKVGIERLDLSSFDNSKLAMTNVRPFTVVEGDGSYTYTKSVFKDLIGLKEVVFGDKFDFNNYGRKNTPDAFMDTDLSGVERVNMLASKEHNDKFIKDWAAEVKTVKNRTDLGTLSLLKDGVAIKSIDDVLSATDSTYEAGMYTIDYVQKRTIYRADESKDYGYQGIHQPVDGPEEVTLGTKPTTEVTYQDFNTRYVADPTRAAGEKFTETEGVRGTTTTVTTYSLNTDTGVVTPTKGQPQVVAPTDKVVKVGTKSTTRTTVIPKVTVYRQADPNAIYESRTTLSEGHDGSITSTTVYTLNEQTGEVIPKIETITVEKEDKIVEVGNRKTEVTFDAFTTVYEPEESMPFNEKREIYAGHAGEITNLIDYDVDPSTGELSNPRNVGGSRTVTLPREIAVGNKKVTTETIRATNRYVGNEEKERGYSNLIEQGRDGSRTITTIYAVNEKTGDLLNPTSTETSTPMTRNVYEVGAKPTITYLKEQNKIVKHTTRVKVDEDTGSLTDVTSTETISEDGAKDKVVTETLASLVRFEKDDQRARGEEDVRTEGRTGTKVTTTTYEVNPSTGEVISTVHEPVITPATETVVKVAAKDKVVFSKEGNKVVKTTTTYTVDPTNGNVSETSAKETISEDGAKDKIVTEELASPIRYEKDDTREKDNENIRTEGRTGTKVTTTTYEVNPETGDLIPTVHEPVITPATETVVKVAAKDKVEMIRKDGETIERTTRYIVDSNTGEVNSEESERLISSSVSDGEGNVIPAPTVEIPEYNGGAVPIDAPIYDKLEYERGVVPIDAPIHEIPEFKGGAVPIDAPVQEIPALEAPVTDHRNDVPSIETRQDDKINASKDADKSDEQLTKRLPDTGQSSNSAGVAGLMLAGLAYCLKRKRS